MPKFRQRLVADLEAMGYAIGPVTKADTYTPPEGVQSAARRALKLIADGHAGDGFTDVGRKRASDLAAGRSVSLDTVKRMHSYFARHAVDKQGKDWDNTEKPSPGKVAWLAWGGDAGKSWADAIVNRDNVAKAYKRKYATQREAAQAAANARWGNRSPKVDAPAEPAGPVIEPWVDQKSAAAVDREFNRRWGQRTLMRLTGLPPEAANGSAEAMNELLTLYPDTTLHLIGTQTGVAQMIKSGTYPPGTPENVISLATRGRYPKMKQSEGGDYTPQLQAIRINKNNHGPDAYGSVSTRISESTGWFTPTGAPLGGPEGIRHAAKRSMTHEFAHAIDFDPKNRTRPTDFSNPDNPINKAQRRNSGAAFGPTGASNEAFIKANVGTYAGTNSRELFAETFTEYHMNPAARPLSVDFVKFRMGELGVPLAAPSTLGTIAKAYKRKYATRAEAARAAANARWGGKASATQETPAADDAVYNPSYKEMLAGKTASGRKLRNQFTQTPVNGYNLENDTRPFGSAPEHLKRGALLQHGNAGNIWQVTAVKGDILHSKEVYDKYGRKSHKPGTSHSLHRQYWDSVTALKGNAKDLPEQDDAIAKATVKKVVSVHDMREPVEADAITKFVSSKRSAAGRKAAEARWGKHLKKFPKALGRMTPRQRASLMVSADKPAKVKFVGPEGKTEEVQRDDAGNVVTERMKPSAEYKRRLYGSDSWVQTGTGPVLGPKAERKKKKKPGLFQKT